METVNQSTRERRFVERGPGLASGLRDLPKHLGIKTMSAGLVAAIEAGIARRATAIKNR